MLQHVVDQLVEPLPAGPRLHGHHRRPGRDCLGHQRVRRLLDEDRYRRPPRLPVDPAQRLVVGDAKQEEDIGRARCRRQAQPHIIGIDQRRRPHRKVQAAWRLHQADHGRVQREQQLAQPYTSHPHVVRFYYRCQVDLVRSANHLRGARRGSWAAWTQSPRYRCRPTSRSTTMRRILPNAPGYAPNWPPWPITRSTSRTSSAAGTGWVTVSGSTSSSRTGTPRSWAP